jgi:hypothetical protein
VVERLTFKAGIDAMEEHSETITESPVKPRERSCADDLQATPAALIIK